MDSQCVPEASGFVPMLNVPVPICLPRTGIPAPSHTPRLKSFLTRRSGFLFAGGPLQQDEHTTYVCLQACCGLQIPVASHVCAFTERPWHIQSITSTHVQIHTHAVKALSHMYLYVESLICAVSGTSAHTASCNRTCVHECVWSAPVPTCFLKSTTVACRHS